MSKEKEKQYAMIWVNEDHGMEVHTNELRPYNPNTRARNNQVYCKLCPSCGAELCYERESGHQHWHKVSGGFKGFYEYEGKVYILCGCGTLIQTRLKPTSRLERKE